MANALRSARQACGLSREVLSERVGVSVKSIQRYEEGRQTPRVDTLYRLSAVLGVTVGDLIGGTGSEVESLLRTILGRLEELAIEMRELRAALPRK